MHLKYGNVYTRIKKFLVFLVSNYLAIYIELRKFFKKIIFKISNYLARKFELLSNLNSKNLVKKIKYFVLIIDLLFVINLTTNSIKFS